MDEKAPFEGLTLLKKFPSRKNSVYLVDRGGSMFVLKLYDSDRWANEREALGLARGAGMCVPAVVEAREKALLLEYIPGRTVNDYLETGEMEKMVLGVAEWLAGFHRAFRRDGEVRIKSDAIFKNFIVSGRICAVDFELSRMGRPEEDVGEALAYLLDTDPMFTEEKYRLARSFIERYEESSDIALDDIERFVAGALREAAKFRPVQRDLLEKKAAEIELSRHFTRGG